MRTKANQKQGRKVRQPSLLALARGYCTMNGGKSQEKIKKISEKRKTAPTRAAAGTGEIMRVKEIFVEQNAAAISVDYYQGQNYTPSDVMRRWAMATYHTFHRGIYGEAYIHIARRNYYYDFWSIEKHDDGTETVTVYLVARD